MIHEVQMENGTYEFLPNTNTDSDINQFFILQDDGTVLNVNKGIQYITQVEEDKSTVGNLNYTGDCATVFDVSSQQYYVDVKDQFPIPNGGNNVYGHNYLIQPETSASQQDETEVTSDPQKLDAQQLQGLQVHDIEALNETKQTNTLTEITLTDEQYRILEHKGWLLLESNDKIFVLNTLGLHDITTNEKLIQKLKNELRDCSDTNTNIEQLKIESITSDLSNDNSNEMVQTEGAIVEYYTSKNVLFQHEESGDNSQSIINENVDQEMSEPASLTEIKTLREEPMSIRNLLNSAEEPNSDTQKCDSLKIKTKYVFKEIPDKIFLGKGRNGKNIFAKVSKLNKSVDSKKNISQKIIYGKKIEKKPLHYSTSLDGAWFTNLIQDSFRHNSKVDPMTILNAATVVSQVLRLPNMKESIVGFNLIITKVITSETVNGKEIGQPTMVTGKARKTEDGEDMFIHIPSMLQQLLEEAGNDPKTTKDPLERCPEEKTAKEVIEIFHIHESETRFMDKAPQITINLCKRKLALDVLSDAKKRHPNPVYACCSCGSVFKSESLLKDHQNNQCIEMEDELTIDADDFKSSDTLYSTIENGNEKVYICTICETKFTRLFNCQKHIKAHKESIEKKFRVHKCKMCPNTYFRSSSLSKHIVKMHLKMKIN